jgi:16S rRNA C967 or C1407 C5-methylase (RsmB/RsmF family)
MLAAGAKDIVDVSNEDFLSVDIGDKKYKSVTCVMLDPSCSGSGIPRLFILCIISP